MTKIFQVILSVIFFQTAHAGLIVVTDFDDTLKISGSANYVDMLINLNSKNVFGGAPEFFQELSQVSNENYVVSDSPKILYNSVHQILSVNQLNKFQIKLNDSNLFFKDANFKFNTIYSIIESHKSDEFILIGDNARFDEVIYSKLKLKFKSQINAVLIHQIFDSKKYSDLFYFHTYFESAVKLYELGIFQAPEVERVARAIIRSDFNKLIPYFADCPKPNELYLKTLTAAQEVYWKYVSSKLESGCR